MKTYKEVSQTRAETLIQLHTKEIDQNLITMKKNDVTGSNNE